VFRHLPPLKALPAFESAARLGSFNAAAVELSVSPGAISYQVKQLESSLGVALFHRRTRLVELTVAGRRLHHTVRQLFQSLDDDIAQIRGDSQDTPLTVSVSTYFVTRWLSPRMGKFLNAHPDTTIRLQHSVNNPEFTVDDVDIAIRWGDGNWPNSQSQLLFELPMIAVCAPSLTKGKTGLRQPSDLRKHTLLHDQPGMTQWSEWLKFAGVEPWQPLPGPVIVDPNVRVQSAIDGQGVVLANPLLQPEIELGHLVEPFDVRLDSYGYYLMVGRDALSRENVRRFMDWIRNETTVS